MHLVYDNQATLHIASNLVFHKKIKYTEMDCHFIREKVESRDITRLVNSNEQLADIFTKVSKRIEDRLYLQQPRHI